MGCVCRCWCWMMVLCTHTCIVDELTHPAFHLFARRERRPCDSWMRHSLQVTRDGERRFQIPCVVHDELARIRTDIGTHVAAVVGSIVVVVPCT
ncbi:hypothetical protein P280DRAFT_153227 [Massarina eburnea CBS 473.64]|uniref:Secreted protein n=1 Tax=Massarina eburnea CBS 473.64 TaxID=1395130 RepID=A0A6A6RMZ1_9PLEO|nr:hypothetical protein P280DRAFT_153227 [Massarina eburnea CBS 473.64]